MRYCKELFLVFQGKTVWARIYCLGASDTFDRKMSVPEIPTPLQLLCRHRAYVQMVELILTDHVKSGHFALKEQSAVV